MKKARLFFSAVIVLIVLFYGCGDKKENPAEPNPYVSTPTETYDSSPGEPTHTATSTGTSEEPAHTATSTVTVTPTEKDLPAEPTYTPTSTATATPTEEEDCFYPYIGDYAQGGSGAYYSSVSGTAIETEIYSYFGNINLTLVIRDAAGAEVFSGDINTAASGYGAHAYVLTGTETSGQWTTGLYDGAELLDEETFYSVSPVPTSSPTPPAMDWPAMYCDPDRALEKYVFKLDPCTHLYYSNRWSSVTDAVAAYYDGADNLVYTEEMHGQVYGALNSSYKISGDEAPGIWRVIVFDPGDTPPAVYSAEIGQSGLRFSLLP